VGWWVLDCDRLPGWPWPGLTWATSVNGGGWAGREWDRTEDEVEWREMELPADSYIMLPTYFVLLRRVTGNYVVSRVTTTYIMSKRYSSKSSTNGYTDGACGVIRLTHTRAHARTHIYTHHTLRLKKQRLILASLNDFCPPLA
jgi:hypothetical protein